MATGVPIYQIKVTLNGSKPPIWRRIQVRSDVTLPRLHMILQEAMGWGNAHLHSFTVGQTEYGLPDPDFGFGGMHDERRVKLKRIATGEGSKFIYEYDFGDSWEHVLLVEKVLPREKGVQYPVCTEGRRACPPEDVGGTWGYEEFLGAIQDPDHPEHEEYLEWIGGEFDPEGFDLDAANKRLRRLK